MSRLVLLLVSVATALMLVACESSDDPGTTPTADVSNASDTAVGSGDAVQSADADGPGSTPGEADAGMPVDAVVQDTVTVPPETEPAEVVYPPGPYGTNKFDVVADLSFFDPWENRWVYLHEFHNDPSKKMLVLIAGAGWCGACRLEADHLVEYYDEYEKDGLGILYTLYQDNSGKELFIPGADATGDMAFMNDWKNEHAVDYPLVADVGFTLKEYFKADSTPLTMVIRTEDMLIKYVDQGYSSTFLDYQILMNLYN